MTRPKAIEVCRALTHIEDMENFIDEVQKIFAVIELGDFEKELENFLEEELSRRNEVLKNL